MNIEDMLKEGILGSPEEIVESNARFRKDIAYFFDNASSIRKSYPNQFIAIYRGKVVAHHKDIFRLVKQLDKDGINSYGVYIGNTYPERTLILTGTA